MRIGISVPFVVCSLLVGWPAAHAAEWLLDRTFTVTPGGLLTVNADGGDITVKAVDGQQVVVHIVARGSQSVVDELKLSAEQTADGVLVEALRPAKLSFSFGNNETRIEVTVPKRYRASLKTSGGDMMVSGLHGDLKGKTSGGDIKLSDIDGPIDVHTSGGDVTATRTTGDMKLGTSGGDVVVSQAKGRVDASTSGGGLHFDTIEGSVHGHTSSGDVIGKSLAGDVDVSTSGGDVKLARVDGKVRANTSGGNVDCEVVGANRGIWANTSGGNIVLTVAKDITATLDAASSGGKIISELPVTTTIAGNKRLTGPINGGGETIYARTSGGSVTLRVAK